MPRAALASDDVVNSALLPAVVADPRADTSVVADASAKAEDEKRL